MTNQEMAKLARMSYIEMQIDGLLPSEVYEIYVKPNFPTAAWRFYDNRHQIVIGEDIFVNANEDIDALGKEEYLGSYLRHELGHSVWTEKDLKFVSDELFVQAIPFALFNLFEDARIEEKMRLHIKKPFNWLKYETRMNYNTLKTPGNALEIFFHVVQSERKKQALINMKKSLPKTRREEFDVVFDFYKRALRCENSLKLIPIIREWIDRFPETLKYIKLIKENGLLFYEESKYSVDDKRFDALLEDAISVTFSTTDADEKDRMKKRRIKSRDPKMGTLLSDERVNAPFDENLRDMLLLKMEKLFYEPLRALPTRIPSKRVNVKRVSTGTEKIFKRKSAQKINQKKITIILDLSGSMHRVIDNMRLLIDVMNKMAQKGLMDANLILTAERWRGATYEVLKMPLEEDVISRIQTFNGAEGLNATMRANMELLKTSDYNWILTDGYIDEKPLNKNFFARSGVHTHAMYIGDVSCKKEMQKSFDHVICESDVEGLAEKIFTLVK